MSDIDGGAEEDDVPEDEENVEDADLDDDGEDDEDDDAASGASSPTATAGRSRGPNAKRGVPRYSLKSAVEFAEKLWVAAKFGDISVEGFAAELGYSTKEGDRLSGRAARKVAAVRSFGLTESLKGKPGRIKLSQIGLDAVQTVDPDKRERALKAALRRPKAYRAILDSLGGHDLPPKATLASRLEFDWGLSKADTTSAAGQMIESVECAGGVPLAPSLPPLRKMTTTSRTATTRLRTARPRRLRTLRRPTLARPLQRSQRTTTRHLRRLQRTARSYRRRPAFRSRCRWTSRWT